MENLEEQKQPRRREEYSPSAASNDGDGLLQSKAVTDSDLTDMKLKAVTQEFLELEIKGKAIAHQLPEDLLMDILSRIPAKSLLQWKSVSKYWYSLIENPSFISLHHTRAQPNDCLFLRRRVVNVNQVALALMASPTEFGNLNLSFSGRHFGDMQLSDSCNGVLCLQNKSEIVICNPAIRESRLLPLPFRQTGRSSYLGFTFDPKANDFKAIKFVTRNCHPCDILTLPRQAMEEHFQNHETECKCPLRPVCFPNVYVYALSTDTWRQTDAVVPDYCIYHVHQSYRCTSSDGVFYWLAHDHGDDVMHICVFRTFEELFERIPLPGHFRLKSLNNICLLKDSLVLVMSDSFGQRRVDRVDTRFDIWVMDEYGVQESWTKKYTVGPFLGCYDALGFRPNVEVLLMRCNYREMVSYDLRTHKIVEYDPLRDTPDSSLANEVFHYTESLISVRRLISKKKKKKSTSTKKKSTLKNKNWTSID
ncbi:hypothetical protein Vadar_025260 [Vaccinium darrowii]|uniref:Uncharacterized protein n=1 Tax=Vaccinium darrowii TaxID=229202 RepID=A0ACB7YY42_9ERIC|nr:hypothetical protein Vadar_025260 [Vaccinium darrowii]